MPQKLVSLHYPPESKFPSNVICKPVGKRRYAAWLGNQFLGHAIARIDGMWTSKTPRDVTFPGRLDLDAALLSLLALHRASDGKPPYEECAQRMKSSVVYAIRPVSQNRSSQVVAEESE